MDMDTTEGGLGLKEMRCEQNVLKNPDGSADYSEGDTNVLVAVYGPADCRESKQLIDKCAIEVSFRPKDGIPGVAEKFLEHTIRNICETVILTNRHPRSQIAIIVQIVQDRGSLLSCAINGVTMALQDAGISMTCMPAAISMAITQRDYEEVNPHLGATDRQQEVVLSPSTKEEEAASSSMLFVLDSTRKNIICSMCKGTLPPSVYRRCLLAAKSASDDVFQFYRDSIAKKVGSSREFS